MPANAILRIHPAIGVTRVGNAARDSYFIGPEIPGFGPLGEAPGTAVPPCSGVTGSVTTSIAIKFRCQSAYFGVARTLSEYASGGACIAGGGQRPARHEGSEGASGFVIRDPIAHAAEPSLRHSMVPGGR